MSKTTVEGGRVLAPWSPNAWEISCTPSRLRAGDYVDTGYLVQRFNGAGYWMTVYTARNLVLAEEAAVRDSAAYYAAGTLTMEGTVHRQGRYRIARAIRTYSDANCYTVERASWEWDGGHKGPTGELRQTPSDQVSHDF